MSQMDGIQLGSNVKNVLDVCVSSENICALVERNDGNRRIKCWGKVTSIISMLIIRF